MFCQNLKALADNALVDVLLRVRHASLKVSLGCMWAAEVWRMKDCGSISSDFSALELRRADHLVSDRINLGI